MRSEVLPPGRWIVFSHRVLFRLAPTRQVQQRRYSYSNSQYSLARVTQLLYRDPPRMPLWYMAQSHLRYLPIILIPTLEIYKQTRRKPQQHNIKDYVGLLHTYIHTFGTMYALFVFFLPRWSLIYVSATLTGFWEVLAFFSWKRITTTSQTRNCSI